MSEPAKISVIIPCYNYGRFLAEALSSVSAQTFSEWECIIVDNGSTDNTRQVAESFIRNDKRFKYLFCENKGVSAARNKGISAASGIYILPLDADDKIDHTYLEKAYKIIESRPELKLVYCEAALFGIDNGKWNLPPFSMKTILKENCIFCTALYRKSEFELAGGYSEEMLTGFEDWDFWLKLLTTDNDAYCIPEILFYYRIRMHSRNNSLMDKDILQLRRKIYHNHKELYDRYVDVPEVIFELYKAQSGLSNINKSKEYRLGISIFNKLRKIKSVIKGNARK
jgi:glycosyltransferase involved in cell wall biosynthesis